jgi:hypothetical protein
VLRPPTWSCAPSSTLAWTLIGIEISAEKVLGDRLTGPTPVSDAFYDAYDETVRTCVAEARSPEMEAG